jgi:hypothetical protein
LLWQRAILTDGQAAGVTGSPLPMRQTLSRVQGKKSLQLQPASSNTIARLDVLNIASSVGSPS